MTPTFAVIVVVLALVLAYDAWAMMKKGYKWTISYEMRAWASKYPIVAMGLGIAFGHLWWSHPGDCADTQPEPVPSAEVSP